MLGAQHVELTTSQPEPHPSAHDAPQQAVANWWFIASEFDWLTPHNDLYKSPEELFERIVPFPEQGPGSHRCEVYVGAYAERAYLNITGVFTPILGELSADRLPHEGEIPPWCTCVLAFQLERLASA